MASAAAHPSPTTARHTHRRDTPTDNAAQQLPCSSTDPAGLTAPRPQCCHHPLCGPLRLVPSAAITRSAAHSKYAQRYCPHMHTHIHEVQPQMQLQVWSLGGTTPPCTHRPQVLPQTSLLLLGPPGALAARDTLLLPPAHKQGSAFRNRRLLADVQPRDVKGMGHGQSVRHMTMISTGLPLLSCRFSILLFYYNRGFETIQKQRLKQSTSTARLLESFAPQCHSKTAASRRLPATLPGGRPQSEWVTVPTLLGEGTGPSRQSEL